jgi:hypothetical protein
MTREDTARERWHLRRHFIVPSLLAYLYTFPNFVTKPFCRFIDLTLSAVLASTFHLKSLHRCSQARGFTDSRLWVHFEVYIKISIEFYGCRSGVDEVSVLGRDAISLDTWSLTFRDSLMVLPSRVMTLEGKTITLSQHDGNLVPAEAKSHPARYNTLELYLRKPRGCLGKWINLETRWTCVQASRTSRCNTVQELSVPIEEKDMCIREPVWTLQGRITALPPVGN